MVKKILAYLNPISHLGDTHYSVLFPLITTVLAAVTLEFIFNTVINNPSGVGLWAIFIFIGLMIYFAFRDGLVGGLTSLVITIGYYFYIIYTQNYQGEQLESGIETTFFLTIIYLVLTITIGWLKQTIDKLVEREAEERRRLQSIVDQLPVGIVITNAKGEVIQSNKRMELIMGMKVPIGHVVGKGFLVPSSYNGKEALSSESPLAMVIRDNIPVSNKEYVLNRKDGKQITVKINATPIHNKQGKMIAAASITTDITAQKEMEHRKDDFINMASHELKTPITSTKLYIDSLMMRIKRWDDERAMKTLGSIKYQTERLQELVNDLLDVSRLQTGKLSFNYEELDLHELINETVDQLRETLGNKRIIYTDKQSIIINADKFRIYQVLTNLITNAVKYSKRSTNIIIHNTKKDRFVTISIQDFGIGIAKDQQKKIFERLYQVNDNVGKTFPGLGMGLYISSEIIKRHKGKIWVKSELGKGSTFFIRLPINKK